MIHRLEVRLVATLLRQNETEDARPTGHQPGHRHIPRLRVILLVVGRQGLETVLDWMAGELKRVNLEGEEAAGGTR